MPILAATNIRHAYGDAIVLDGCTLNIEPGERIGLVGRNGAGKSTLVKVLTGQLKPDSGDLAVQRGARIGHLTQDHSLDPNETLRGAAESAFAELHALHQQLDTVFEKMAADDADLDKLLKQQERLERQIEAAGGYAVDHKIDAVLHGLGFTDAQFSIKVKDLSGGQKSRLSLAKLLLEDPDALLLDEPTNHLDLDGRLWLENFLKEEYHGAVLMITHDRYMLDSVVSRIVEIEMGRAIDYPGNYRAFRIIRAERRLSQHRAFENQQSKWRQQEAYIRKYKAGQRAKQAKGRETRLDREREQSALEAPVELANFSLELPKPERTGDVVVSARGMSKKYTNKDGSDKVLFHDLDLTVSRGERWGIIGPNGAGKSTLVRCLLSEQQPDAGAVRLGTNVKVGYFRQTHEGIDPSLNVYRYLQRVIQKENPGSLLSEQAARNLAGAFLFSGAEQEKEMGVLSGGERARAVLAGLLASAKNVLVLDEPTNHLDIPGAERLEDALALPVEATSENPGRDGGAWEGTLILISHDRALIDACCDHLLILDAHGNAEIFLGNYSQWHARQQQRATERQKQDAEDKRRREEAEKRERAAQQEKLAQQKQAQSKQKTGNPLERLQTAELEKRIEQIESRIRAIDASLNDPDVWRDPAKCAKLGDERTKLMEQLEPLEFEWTRRAEELA